MLSSDKSFGLSASHILVDSELQLWKIQEVLAHMELKTQGNYGDSLTCSESLIGRIWWFSPITPVRLAHSSATVFFPLCSAFSFHPIRHTSHGLSEDLYERGVEGLKSQTWENLGQISQLSWVLFSKSVEWEQSCFPHMAIVITLKTVELRGSLDPLCRGAVLW